MGQAGSPAIRFELQWVKPDRPRSDLTRVFMPFSAYILSLDTTAKFHPVINRTLVYRRMWQYPAICKVVALVLKLIKFKDLSK